MDSGSEKPVLLVHEPLRLIFCNACMGLVIPVQGSVHSHMTKCRTQLPKSKIDEAINQLDPSIWEPDPKRPPWTILSDRLPDEVVDPILFLATRPVVFCKICGKTRADRRSWMKTCKVEHDVNTVEAESFTAQEGHCLSLGLAGERSVRYIAVTHAVHLQDLELSLCAMANLVEESIAPGDGVIEETRRYDANLFVRGIGFDKHLQGFKHADLVDALEPRELPLKGLLRHIRDLLLRIKLDMADEGDIVMRQLRRRSDNVDPASLEIFNYDILNKTLNSSYMSTIGRLIRYVWKICEWGDQSKSPCQLTGLQTHSIRAVMAHNWDTEGDDLGVQRDGLVFDLFKALLTHRVHTSQFDSVVLSCMAVLGLDTCGRGWRDARGYGSCASAVIKIGLMLVYGMVTRDTAIEGTFLFPELVKSMEI